MSKIDEQIQQLILKKKKIEFLNHIHSSAKDYEHEDFKEVKESVIELLSSFVQNAINSIENDSPLSVTTTTTPVPESKTFSDGTEPVKEQSKETKKPRKDPEASPSDKLSFALDNRHLSGKKVTVANDKNMTVTGEVVGLDAPFVVVKTDTGPVIKVPLGNISLA